LRVGIIADDLTGGNGTGVRLAKQGFDVATMVYYNKPIIKGAFNAVIVDTDSRYVRKDVAEMRVQTVLENLKNWNVDIVCKRIDSTVRGNIGIEIDTILTFLGEKSIAVVVGSFPDSGRTTAGGYLLVHGAPVQTTDVAKDPVTPLTQSYIPSIIKNQSQYPVSHIGLDTVLDGEKAILQEIREQIAKGNRIIVFDAITDEEIEEIANAMAQIKDYTMIPADPGPLTAFYAKAYSQQYESQKKIIVTVGSVTSNTGKQLEYLINKSNSKPVYVDPEKLVGSLEVWEKEVKRATAAALEVIHHQDILIITTHSPSAEKIDMPKLALEQNVSKDFLAKRIADGLGKITRLVIQETTYEIGGCFSSGGDVTASLCSIGLVDGIKLESEVLPIVAYGRFIGGYFDGISVVTKGGLIGDTKAIYTCVKYLMEKGSSVNNELSHS
jgi:uncharacterized protein YgbK (DUF1537 family)